MHDPVNFSDPDEFKPERFLSEDGKAFHTPKAYVAFGMGKRECLGKSLAKVEQYLFTAALIHQFE